MKFTKILAIVFSLVLLAGVFAACDKAENKEPETKTEEKTETKSDGGKLSAEGLWSDAVYLEDKELGEGAKTVKVEVKAEDKSVTFTLKTDKDTLADALLEQGLIKGDKSEYGIYVTVVNGITAIYEQNQAYWGFYKNGEMLMTGADATRISDGEHYEIVYSK